LYGKKADHGRNIEHPKRRDDPAERLQEYIREVIEEIEDRVLYSLREP
jgi:hypothetical protein